MIELSPHVSYSWRFVFTDKSTGNPIDISGRVLSFTAKRSTMDVDAKAVISISNEFPSNSESQAGLGYLFIAPEKTANLIQGESVFIQFMLTWEDSLGRLNNKVFGFQRVTVGKNIKETIPAI